MGTTNLAVIDDVRARVQSLMVSEHGGPVRIEMRRTGGAAPCWRFTARVRSRTRTDVSFARRWLEINGKRIVLRAGDGIEFVEAGWNDRTFTVCVAETPRVPPATSVEATHAGELIRLATDAVERLADPAKMIAVTRALRAVTRAIEHAPVDAVVEAAAAPSDIGVVVRALQQPDAIDTLKSEDPLGPARLRGLSERQRLLDAEGGTWSVAEVAAHLKLTRQAVNRRRQLGTLIGLDAGRHGYLYPAWQFARDGTLPHLESMLAAVGERDPWLWHAFAISPNQRLGASTPLDALRAGRLDDVRAAARAFGDHGAA